MTQIFVFPAGDYVAQQNLKLSIESPIKEEEKIFASFEETGTQERERLERIRQEGNGFYAWGAKPSADKGNERTWAGMKRGDYVLAYYKGAYRYVSNVLAKYNNPELAQAIWKEDTDGETWEYVYFMTQPVKIDAPTSWVADSLGLSNKEYRRFTRIAPSKVASVINAQGSVDNFINHLLDRRESGMSTSSVFAPVLDSDLGELEDGEDLGKVEVDREMATMRERLAQVAELREGLEVQVTQTSARRRSAAFAISVKRLYGYRCAICGSGLQAPNRAPEVQSAHIYPKKLDGRDDVRNGICLCRRHHWALDVGWISIADDYTILVHEDLPDHDDYLFIGEYEGEGINLPSVTESAPNSVYLQEHRKLMGFE